MPDYYHLREVVTERFFDRHVVIVQARSTSDLAEIELDEVAKKLAENLYLSRRREEASKEKPRDIAINTVLVLGWEEVMDLKAEVKRMQPEYARAAPFHDFITVGAFPHYERGTKEGTPAAKKRATYLGRRNFIYGVVRVQREHGTDFKIDHHGGVLR